MNNLIIEATKSTPGIQFDGVQGIFRITGESYPENAAKFYTPVTEWLENWLQQPEAVLELEFEIIYFNSSSSKIFMNIFDLFERAVAAGKKASVVWRCDAENETAIECGEEFSKDLVALPFRIEIIGV